VIIHVRLHTILRRKTPEGVIDRLDLELGPEATVETVLSRLDIKLQGRSVLLVLNGKLVDRAARLSDGDELRLVPAISGG
jgi:molybdopterin converting factor small subunit